MAIAITSTLGDKLSEQSFSFENNNNGSYSGLRRVDDVKGLTSLRGIGRVLAQRTRATTCDKYPRICRATGSPGPDCCRKRCVNVMRDRLNCGRCGKRCKYSEICCKGKCVNPMLDKKNCGGCTNNCKKGSSCLYGMCSYAN